MWYSEYTATILRKSSDYIEKYKSDILWAWQYSFKHSYLHGQRDSVDDDQGKDGILKRLGGNKPPDLVLPPRFGDVAPHWFHFQSKLYALPL